jgi:hypothetical protein
LYDYGENGIAAIAEYRRLARAGNVFFILAASRINVGKYIFPPSTNNKSICPNLNCGFFQVTEVHPIRTIPEFIEYWYVRFSETLDEAAAHIHYWRTGGVGRYILLSKQRNDVPLPVAMTVFQSCPALFHTACSILQRPVATVEILQYVKIEELDDWIDRLIFYNNGTHVSFLLETVKDEFLAYVGTKQILHQAHIFHIQRKGFDGGSSGHSNEAFISRFLPSLFNLRPHSESLFMSVIDDAFRMSLIESQGTDVWIPDVGAVLEMNNFLSEYSERLISWQIGGKETGLDRIWWNWDLDSKILTLYGV